MKTVRRPPYPKWNPGYFPCSSLTPPFRFPHAVHRCPSVDSGLAKLNTSVVGRAEKDAVISFFTPVFFERDVFPYYGDVSADGRDLWELVQGDYDVLVTRNLANRHDIDVGNGLKLSGIDRPFTVKGILSPDALGRVGDPLSGNVLFALDTIERLFPDLGNPVSEVYILAPDASDDELAVLGERLESISPLLESTTPAEMEAENQETADDLRTVILVFGLVALAIGGMGIANTMQVLVSRRLPEAGVLKAIGLKGRQVTLVFLTDALVIGVVGSVPGVLVGLGISYLAVRVMGGLVFTNLPWRIGAESVIAGLVVGIIIALAFGLLPAVGAGRVRPMAAFRPNDRDLFKGSWLASTLLLLFLAAVMGVMVGALSGNLIWGIVGAFGAFAAVGILLLVFVGIVYPADVELFGRIYPGGPGCRPGGAIGPPVRPSREFSTAIDIAMVEDNVVLRGSGLTKQFRSGDLVVDALRGVDVTFTRGEVVAIIGLSGSGKTTLLGILGGLDTPTKGSLQVEGVDITDLGENQLARIRNDSIGFVFNQFNLMPTLTALENVALPVQFSAKHKFNPRQRGMELLTSFGLADRMRNRPGQLSRGEQRRVAIARALANDPPLLLCDEPTGSLDTENGELVMNTLFKAQRDLNTAVVIVTHDPRIADRADRTLVMTDGRLAHR